MVSPSDSPAGGSSPEELPPQQTEGSKDSTPKIPRNPFIVPLFPRKKEAPEEKTNAENPVMQPERSEHATARLTPTNASDGKRSEKPETAATNPQPQSFYEEKIAAAELPPAYSDSEALEEEHKSIVEKEILETVGLLSSGNAYGNVSEYNVLPKFEAFKRPSPPPSITPPPSMGRSYAQKFENIPNIPDPPETSPKASPQQSEEQLPTTASEATFSGGTSEGKNAPADYHPASSQQNTENGRSSIIDIKIGEDLSYPNPTDSTPKRSFKLLSDKKLFSKNSKKRKRIDSPPEPEKLAAKPSDDPPPAPAKTKKSSKLSKLFGHDAKKERVKNQKDSPSRSSVSPATASLDNPAADSATLTDQEATSEAPPPLSEDLFPAPEKAASDEGSTPRSRRRDKRQRSVPVIRQENGEPQHEAFPEKGDFVSAEEADQWLLPDLPVTEKEPQPAEFLKENENLAAPQQPVLKTAPPAPQASKRPKKPKKAKEPRKKVKTPKQKKKQPQPATKQFAQLQQEITPLPPITPPPKIIPIPQPKRYASKALAKVAAVMLKSLIVILVAALLSITTLTVLYLNAINAANSPNEKNRIEIYDTNLTLIETVKRLKPTLSDQYQALLSPIASDLEKQNKLLEKTNTVTQAKPLDVYTVPDLAKELNANAHRAYDNALDGPSNLSALFASISISQYFKAQSLVEAGLADSSVLSWTFSSDVKPLEPDPYSCGALTDLSRASSKNHVLFSTSRLEQNIIYLLEVEKARKNITPLATPENILFHKKQQQNLNYYLGLDCVEAPQQEAAFSLPVDFRVNPQRTILEQIDSLMESYTYLVSATPAPAPTPQSSQIRSFAVNSMFSTAEILHALEQNLGATPGIKI